MESARFGEIVGTFCTGCVVSRLHAAPLNDYLIGTKVRRSTQSRLDRSWRGDNERRTQLFVDGRFLFQLIFLGRICYILRPMEALYITAATFVSP